MNAVAGRSPIHIGALSDSQLVELARAGHEPAFDAIVHRYRAPLVSYCRRWLDPHRAEEVVQHTLMKAFLCLRDDQRPLALRPWLYRVAHNAALNAVEKKGSDWEELDESYDGVPQPSQVAEQRARFLRVVDEIEALPVRQREALVLNEFEGRCYADIAAELGTSESGVRGLLRRARRQLREAAALLLPFPALRELIRSDAGRALQADRAGELIGSAGAAGGIGAAGGFAKVAAGVLAAGTIAGGGMALEHRDGAWQAPPRAPQADAADAAQQAARHGGARAAVARLAGGEANPFAPGRLRLGGGRLVSAAGFQAPAAARELSLGDIEQAAVVEEVVTVAPAPLAPSTGPVPVPTAQDEPAQQTVAGEVDTTTESTSGTDGQSTDGTESAQQTTPAVPTTSLEPQA